ncbi:hypothetical protein O3M35_001465 [Rhynocoris fuscipes]|uniref:J domain-containing protein n=1 Tax=Rhynocoris fuscipes TaxID=488301 RepID=A0AAW1CQ51_9HEMI
MSGHPQQPGDQSKKRCIDDIIDHMTADLQSYDGQYLLLGTPSSTTSHAAPPIGDHHPVWGPSNTHQSNAAHQNIFYPSQMRETNEMIGMVDVGGGKYVNVVFPKPNSSSSSVNFVRYQQPTQNLVPPIIDYQRTYNEAIPNGCLIENVVGNWVPNRTGTYSPFGGSLHQDEPTISTQTSTLSTSQSVQPNQQQTISMSSSHAPPNTVNFNQKFPEKPVGISMPEPPPQMNTIQSPPVRKQRIVAEVKPMRPSYSDIVAKSAPLTPPPTAKLQNNSKPAANLTSVPKNDIHLSKKYHIKNNTTGNKASTGLKRESSSGSDEALAEKVKVKRWSSQEDLSSNTSRINTSLEHSKKEKKRRSKPASNKVNEKEDKDILGDTRNYREQEIKINRKEPTGPCVAPAFGTKPCERPASKPKTRDERKSSAGKGDRNLNSSRSANRSKRTQRNYRKRDSSLGALCKKWKEQSSYYLVLLSTWLINLLWDVMALSTSLLIHMFHDSCTRTGSWVREASFGIRRLIRRWWWWERKEPKPKPPGPPPSSLTHNITLPASGSDAIKRLLSCKGKDPYSILGVTSTCTDEEIKKYYKSQALLVHPDKNSQPGAEEAFKILVHAFDLIAEPTKRAAYDRYVSESNQVEQAWSELSDLLSQLHEKMEYAANTIRCNNCGKRHKREVTERPCYAARFCAQCKIHHSAKEGDMWAESRCWGWWSSRYLACIEGGVYDITEWAHCQGDSIQSVRPDSHMVQYRLVMAPRPEPDFEDLLNSLYSQNGNSSRSKKKSKKNK